MDNNPLPYVRESKLGAAQIRWHSQHTLFDFDIKYRTGGSDKAPDALICHHFVPGEMNSASDSDGYEIISYATVCEELEDIIDGEKLPIECKLDIQEKDNKPAKQDLEMQSSVSPKQSDSTRNKTCSAS